MAQTIGGIAGAAIGFAIGGPAGAQWGWAIGSAAGSSFTTIKQPRIGDLAEIRAGEGGPRARVYGTFRPIGGQVVWSGRPREIRTRKRQGKGGPKVESSTILRSYAIGICEGPIVGVSRIWRNNELVYDVRPGSAILAESARWIQGKTILTGTWTQGVHPTIEAEAGPANAPAMRGTALLVVTDEDLTDLRGAIPSYQFEVGPTAVAAPPRYDVPPPPVIPAHLALQFAGSNIPPGVAPRLPYFPNPLASATLPPSTQAVLLWLRNFTSTANYSATLNGSVVLQDLVVPPNTDRWILVPASGGDLLYLSFDVTSSFDAYSTRQSFVDTGAELSGIFVAGGGEERLLPSIVRSVCRDASLPPALIDTSQLPQVRVEGFSTSPEYSAAEAIRELAKVYFFDVQDADGKVRFISRGGNFTAILTEDEFIDGEDEPETDTTRDALSVPRLLHLQYFDVAGGQGPDKQFSERQISTRSEAPTVLQTPIVLDAETAARTIRVQHQVMEEELRGELVFGVSDRRIALAESDVVIVQYRGRSQRCRITKIELMDGWQRITAVRDRQSAYTVQVQPVPPAPVARPPESIPGATRFAFLDIPALSQAGDVLSYHLAVSGEQAGWRGAVIERQEVGGEYGLLTTDGIGTVMGTLTQALPEASPWYPDESNAVVVQLARADDDLEAVTREVWLGRGNAAALVRADGTAEVLQFRDAVETTPGTWRLTGLQRGRLNSGASAHAIGTTFVLLDGAQLVQAPSERLATTITHRAYSVGELPSTATPVARAWTGRSQREWPPIIESATRTGDTLSVTWTPRHRFGSDENPVPSSHFDGWQVDATSGGATRSATVLTPTASLDVTGLANPITVTVRGRNRLAGLGDPATRTVP